MQHWRFLPSLIHLHDAHSKLNSWHSAIQPKEVGLLFYIHSEGKEHVQNGEFHDSLHGVMKGCMICYRCYLYMDPPPLPIPRSVL